LCSRRRPINEAVGFADAIERYGHVPAYGIHFAAGRAELLPDSNDVLREIAVMLELHPDWRIRIESHSDNSGNKMNNMTMTARRASAVATWLVGTGDKGVASGNHRPRRNSPDRG
jgi:flagellar motor protein MotB